MAGVAVQGDEEGNLWVEQEVMGAMRMTKVRKKSLHQQMEVLKHPENQGRRKRLQRNQHQLRRNRHRQTARQTLKMKGFLNPS